MNRLSFVLLAAVSVAANAQGAIDPATAAQYFNELRQLGAADGGKMWGVHVDGPMMFVDPSSGAIVANEPDAQGTLFSQGALWVGTLPRDMNPANTAVDFGGKKFSMVMWPVSDSRYGRDRLLMHESFHRIQDKLGLPASNPANAHLVTADARIWTRLEWRALTEALLRTGAERKQALADALTFRARRRSGSAQAAEDERTLELNEGLAEYTGLRLSGLPASVLNDRAALILAQNESQESFVRSFAYSSGPAYGLLLDAVSPAWRKSLKATSDLSSIAAQAYRITTVDPKTAESLIHRYSGERMVADERAREARRLANESRLKSLFADSAVLRLPVGSKFSFSFDPNGVMPVAGLGTVYQTVRVSDDWGTLDVDDADVLMARRSDGAITSVFVALPSVSGNTIKGKGWTVTLAPGWLVTDGTRKGELTVAAKDKR